MNQHEEVAPRQYVSSVQRFVGTSRAAQEAREFAERVSKSDLTVLLRGETGVGKDHLAELIHQAGYNGKPFVVVDCGALTESLSEIELFGHARGAFTDAREEKVGLVKVAEDGTLFFNEVANMSLGLQAKFLRILDKRPYRAVGGRTEIQVRTRIIAATNANLEEAVKARAFRLDLFHRLNVLSFSIASLRDRNEDIPELISAFLNGNAERFSPAALAVMMEYDWPGNVRELMNVVQRAAFMSREKEIDLEQIRPYLTSPTDKPSFPTLYELERNYLRDVLKVCKGVQRKAAEIAGISPRVMNYKIKSFDLEGFVDRLRGELLN
ncbi:MAG: sigma-54-dependent Fis family transcriptional regulator [Parcubacteria group bacterium]|nr:sigma-54-dependent Fis family transcriptional regulator [Parcubacteria group bacterium]